MAISYIGKVESSDSFAQTALSASVTVSAGSDRCLLVCVQARSSFPSRFVTSITFNTSESFTRAVRRAYEPSPDWISEIWYLVNPTVTTANVTVNWSSAPEDLDVFTVVQLQGVHQSSTINTTSDGGAAGTDLTCTITPNVDNCLILDSAIGAESGTFSADGTQTEITNRLMTGNSIFDYVGVSRFQQATAAAKALHWTQSTSSPFAIAAVAIAPAIAAAPSVNVSDTATIAEDVKMHMPISLKMMKVQ